MNPIYVLLTILFVISAVAMILIILVQRPQGGGLAGAFGGSGGGGTDSVFGGRVGDALTKVTVAAFLVFLGLAIALNLTDSRDVGDRGPAADSASADLNAPVDDTGDTSGPDDDAPTFDPGDSGTETDSDDDTQE